jgi:hypothetical protein
MKIIREIEKMGGWIIRERERERNKKQNKQTKDKEKMCMGF